MDAMEACGRLRRQRPQIAVFGQIGAQNWARITPKGVKNPDLFPSFRVERLAGNGAAGLLASGADRFAEMVQYVAEGSPAAISKALCCPGG